MGRRRAADGTEDLPVGGVSWYEARAYARFAGKELPTVVEWNAAAIPEAARWVVPQGRYEATSPVRGGDERGVSPRGVYDMAGNVREWTVNAREPGSRYILGGGWTDPAYLFSEIYTQPEFDRSAINGIRLVQAHRGGKDLAAASAPIPGLTRDYNTCSRSTTRRSAASSRCTTTITRRSTRRSCRATRRPPTGCARTSSSTCRAAAERMPAVLFLPKRVKAPYQTVVIWPASDAFILRDRQHLSMSFVDYLVRSGRAVLYPIYEHTYGRGTAMAGRLVPATIEHRDQMLRWAKEMRRSIDYAVTRPDIDTTRLALCRHELGRAAGRRDDGDRAALQDGRPQRGRDRRWSCVRKKTRSTSCRASTFRC